jgi:hypothetical protein
MHFERAIGRIAIELPILKLFSGGQARILHKAEPTKIFQNCRFGPPPAAQANTRQRSFVEQLGSSH